MVGCGNSPFSEELYDLGYPAQVNCDNCKLVIDFMQQRAPHLQWDTCDVRDMPYATGRFPVVLDKGLLDNLYCYADPELHCARAVADMYRVLQPGGLFLVMSCHAEEEVRASLTADPAWQWEAESTLVLKLRNPRWPATRVPCYTLIAMVKATDADTSMGVAPSDESVKSTNAASETPVDQSSVPVEMAQTTVDTAASAVTTSSLSEGSAKLSIPSGSSPNTAAVAAWGLGRPFPSLESLASLISPEDGLPLLLSPHEAAELAAEASRLNEESRASLQARIQGATQQQQQQQQQYQEAEEPDASGLKPLPGAPPATVPAALSRDGSANGGGDGVDDEYSPPNGTFAQQLQRRRSSLSRAPPLAPPPPLFDGDEAPSTS
jgi:hypothetical protein